MYKKLFNNIKILKYINIYITQTKLCLILIKYNEIHLKRVNSIISFIVHPINILKIFYGNFRTSNIY